MHVLIKWRKKIEKVLDIDGEIRELQKHVLPPEYLYSILPFFYWKKTLIDNSNFDFKFSLFLYG